MSVGGTPPTWAPPSGSLNDARHRAGSTTRADGLKVHAAKSGGENVVGAVLFGTYWFARSVNELSARSRLASPRSTTTVETDHPLLSSHSRALPRSAAPGPTLYSRTGLPATPRRRACPHASSRIDRRDRSAVERCSDHPKHHRAKWRGDACGPYPRRPPLPDGLARNEAGYEPDRSRPVARLLPIGGALRRPVSTSIWTVCDSCYLMMSFHRVKPTRTAGARSMVSRNIQSKTFTAA